MLASIIIYKYWILAPLGVAEGPILSFVCGAAASFGYLNPFVAYGILVLCAVAPDLFFFYLGRWGAHLTLKESGRLSQIREGLGSLTPLWLEHGLITATTSKLAYGFGAPVMVGAGLSGLRPSIFLRYSLTTSGIVLALLMAAGYFFASYYLLVRAVIHNAELVVGSMVVLFFVGFYFLSKRMRGRLRRYRTGPHFPTR